MPSFAAALRAISVCVQNQTTNAPAITPARRPTPVQDRLAKMMLMESEVWGLGSGGWCAGGFCFPPAYVRVAGGVHSQWDRRRQCDRATRLLRWLRPRR